MKILITGGLGFIGLNLISSLGDRHKIVIVDKVSADNVHAEFLSSPNIQTIRGDICDLNLLCEILNREKFDCIVHLCAISSVAEAESNRAECDRVNVYGSKMLLQALSKSRSKNAALIFASSREVYGDTKGLALNEDSIMQPINHYGKSKLKAQRLIEYYAKANHNPCIIFQLANVYGGKFDKPSRVIPSFSANILKGQELCIYGGEQILDFVHISDVMACLRQAIEVLPHIQMCERFILSSGRGVSIKELVSLLEQALHTQAYCNYRAKRDFEVASFIGDNAKAKAFFNIKFKDITQGLALYAALLQGVFQYIKKERVC